MWTVLGNWQLNDNLEALGSVLAARYGVCCSGKVRLGSLLELVSGFPFKSKSYVDNGAFRILTIKNVRDGSVDCSGANRINEVPRQMKAFCHLKIGDVVLSLTGNVGRIGIVSEPNCLLNQRVAVLLPKAETSLAGLYFWFRQNAFKNRLVGIARGTAQANLSPVETLELEIPYDENRFTEFCADAQPLFNTILINMREALALARIRDALLPKLMSGEVDISKIELPAQPNSCRLERE